MSYAITGIVALVICLIINKDLLLKKSELTKAYKIYRIFLLSIMIFFITDAIWGLLDEYHLITLLKIDTVLFFVSMNLSVSFWAAFAALYVNKSKKMNIALLIGGISIFVSLIVLSIINISNPILFEFADNEYIPHYGRYILFILQIVLFAIVSFVTLLFFFIDKKNPNRHRYLAIGLFGLFMALSIIGQLFFPLLPMYSAGSIISICMIHVFVVGSEKDEVIKELIATKKREQITGKELDFTKTLVYVDSLTGAKSKHAFVELENKIDVLISNRNIDSFSVVVFDINDLKLVNDTKGHEYGDIYIQDSYKIIKDVYQNTEIYRFGGDEFVGILDGIDYVNKDKLLEKFNAIIDKNISSGKPVVAAGMSNFNETKDTTFNSVFTRADEEMYNRKKHLKSLKS